MNTAELSCICKQVRRDIINMTANAGSGHPGGSPVRHRADDHPVLPTDAYRPQKSQGPQP